MKWADFLEGLDVVRSNIRARGPAFLNEEADLNDKHAITSLVYTLLNGKRVDGAVHAETPTFPPNPPAPPRPKEKPVTVAANSHEGAKLTAYPREGGYVPGKQPVLEEAEENE